VLVLAAALSLLLPACTTSGPRGTAGGAASAAGGGAAGMRIALITHAPEGDTFWDLVRRGAETAAAKDGVRLTYAADPDAAGQAELVRQAVREKADGIAVTLAKPQAMRGAVAGALAAGIPVVGLNSGMDAWRSVGLLQFFGQDENLAGRAVGDRLDNLGARHALCVIHERGNVGLEARCAGVRSAFDGRTENLYVTGTDAGEVAAVLTDRLRQDPTIDQVITLGAPVALTAVASVRKAGSEARVATFDLDAELVKAVRSGAVQFAVDQQPYLQGYLAVDSLWLHRTNGHVSGGGVAPVLTGPAFVTRENVGEIAEFAANGTR
jgi:simple sugar transport system substrate-binding protein